MNAKLTQDELQAIKERANKPLISTIDKPMTYASESRQDITKLVAEVERLREALEFYADKANYGVYTDASNNCPTTNTLMDDGHIAREALK